MSAPSVWDAKLRAGGRDAEEARKAILAALEAGEGNLPKSAEQLGVAARTFSRFLDKAGLQEEAARVRARYGQVDYRYIVMPNGDVLPRVRTKKERAKRAEAKAKAKKRAGKKGRSS